MPRMDQVEAALAARIAAVVATPYVQVPGDVFRESSIPLTAIEDASHLGHLRYSVWLQSSTRGGSSRDGYEDDVDGSVWVQSRIVVALCYRIRSTRQVDDARLAARAAGDIARAIMAAPSAGELADGVDIITGWVDPYRPQVTADGGWILVLGEYQVQYDFELND
jgi:hypothetical protein